MSQDFMLEPGTAPAGFALVEDHFDSGNPGITVTAIQSLTTEEMDALARMSVADSK